MHQFAGAPYYTIYNASPDVAPIKTVFHFNKLISLLRLLCSLPLRPWQFENAQYTQFPLLVQSVYMPYHNKLCKFTTGKMSDLMLVVSFSLTLASPCTPKSLSISPSLSCASPQLMMFGKGAQTCACADAKRDHFSCRCCNKRFEASD